MAVKVTTEVAEVEATKAPMGEEGQVQTDVVFTAMMLSVVVCVVGIVPGLLLSCDRCCCLCFVGEHERVCSGSPKKLSASLLFAQLILPLHGFMGPDPIFPSKRLSSPAFPSLPSLVD